MQKKLKVKIKTVLNIEIDNIFDTYTKKIGFSRK